MSNQPNGSEQVNPKASRTFYGARRRMEGEPIAEAMRRTEAALRQPQSGSSPSVGTDNGSDGSTQDQPSDPAPSVPAIAEERAQQLIANISSQMLGELRSLRDQIDALMRDMNERRDLIRDAIRAHAEFAEAAIQHKIIIGESVDKLRAEFEASRTPLPPARNV